jgi:uncharacterized protein involved in exopolysaccharide biosynthesis
MAGAQQNLDNLESAGSNLLDFELIRHYVGFAFGAVRRWRGLAVSLFLAIFGVTLLGLYVMPKTYHVETKLLTQQIKALSLPGAGEEAPTRVAADTIMRRDNLVAIIHQVDLPNQWYKRRAPLPHLRDIVYRALTKPETEAQMIDWLADVLEKRMVVTTNDFTVNIAIDWPDPAMALLLVDTAEQNYLEARRATEVTAIAEELVILQKHASAQREEIDSAVDAIEKLRAERTAAAAATATIPIEPAAPPKRSAPGVIVAAVQHHSAEPDPELTQLKVMIEAKQRAITDLEDFRRRRLSELNATLAEKLPTYTENHPVIIDLRQTLAALSSESPQVQALRADVAHLQAEFAEKRAKAEAESRTVPLIMSAGGTSPSIPPPLPGSIIRIERETSDDRDPAMVYAKTQLSDAMSKYSQLRSQIETSQIASDTAEAAFKYRYSVVDPAAYPKKPSKPNAPLIALAGLIGALVVAMFATAAADIRKGLFVVRGQVVRALDLPILTEMDARALAKPEP